MEATGQVEILGRGTMSKTFVSEGKHIKLTFKNVLHSPFLAANLISISALDKAGLSMIFADEKAVVKDKSGSEIFVGCGSEEMYVLESVPTPQAMSSRATAVPLSEWHRCFVHMSPKMIEEMASKGLVDGLNTTPDPLLGKCKDCILVWHMHHPLR